MPDRFGIPTQKELMRDFFPSEKPRKKTVKKHTKKKITPTKREHVPMVWKEKILFKQKKKCAGKNCAKFHFGRKMPIDVHSNFDHIKPLALGGKHILSNVQGLCTKCHMSKTREDRYKISQYKKKHGIKSKKKPTTKKKSTRKPKDPFDIDLPEIEIPKF